MKTQVYFAIVFTLAANLSFGDELADVVYPMVRVQVASDYGVVGGSGTIVYSDDRSTTGEFETFILTNHHVVNGAITFEEKYWDPLLARERKREERRPVDVHMFAYNSRGVVEPALTFRADIVAWSKDEDLALLQLRSTRQQEHVARLLPRAQAKTSKTALLSEITAVGSQLGFDPVVTRGEITGLAVEIENRRFWMISSAIIYGESGGAVFLRDSREFVGVPARVAGYGWGSVAAHLGFCIPIYRIYDWFESEKLDFLYDPVKSPRESFEERKRLQEKARLRIKEN